MISVHAGLYQVAASTHRCLRMEGLLVGIIEHIGPSKEIVQQQQPMPAKGRSERKGLVKEAGNFHQPPSRCSCITLTRIRTEL